jgi:diguanylate cyclase (GGDEF)-like protein
MKLFRTSIRARLTLLVCALCGLLIFLAAVSALILTVVDGITEEIDNKWLAATQTIDELGDSLEEFRVAEGYRALAHRADMRLRAEALAAGHRHAILAHLSHYAALMRNDGDTDIVPLRNALTRYFAAHDAWISADVDGEIDAPAGMNGALQARYQDAEALSDRLIEANRVTSHARAASVDRLVDNAIGVLVITVVAAILLAIWLVARVHIDIAFPLGTITRALSRLAAGDRNVRMPALDRNDEIGEMANAFDVFRANAEALEAAHCALTAAETHAQRLARHDPLTGLPNRRVLAAELQKAVDHVAHAPQAYLVLVIDLDRFKPVNDLQGHAAGDFVLCEIARRLEDVVRKGDTIARLGGDEFAIVAQADPLAYADAAMQLANRLLAAIRKPVFIADSQLYVEVGASIGIAALPNDGRDPETLLRAADIAMYRAKREGKGTSRFFEESMDRELREQALLEIDLRRALCDGQIRPHYQPLVDMQSGALYGFEILARWHHPVRGDVAPDVFVPIAENLGLISELTAAMLRRACRDASAWPDAAIRLSLNISPTQLNDRCLPAQLLPILAEERFAPSRLELEITETALAGDIKIAKTILTDFQRAGIKVSLDDFGTGYSSLYHLRELKFDKVKIDKSFVLSMQRDNESEKIVDAILSLAHSLGMPAVAEGIETREALHRLRAKGCEYGQGYHFGKAMSARDVATLLCEA